MPQRDRPSVADPPRRRLHVAILGTTGSVGRSTLDVLARHPDRFDLIGLSAHRRIDSLVEAWRPALAMAVCLGTGTVLGGVRTWWAAESVQPARPAALALSAAAVLHFAWAQSAHRPRDGHARLLSQVCSLPLLAGHSIIAGSPHAPGLFG